MPDLEITYNLDGTLPPLDTDLVTIKTPTETFQAGFVPQRTRAQISDFQKEFKSNLALFRSTKNVDVPGLVNQITMIYSFDLTDGKTTYKMRMSVASGAGLLSNSTTFFVDSVSNQPLEFPQENFIKHVSFDLKDKQVSFIGTTDMIPLTVTISTSIKRPTLREFRSRAASTTRKGSR